MATRNLLVVATVPVDEQVLREHVRRYAGGAETRVHIVAPASDVSPLQWLASDDDGARVEAEAVAAQAADALAEDADTVEAEVGDSDPVQAIEDALRTFPADELVLVTRPGKSATWLEQDSAAAAFERFDLPVTHLAVDD